MAWVSLVEGSEDILAWVLECAYDWGKEQGIRSAATGGLGMFPGGHFQI